MANRNLTWSEHKGLNELYTRGETKLKLLSSGYIRKLKTEKKLIDSRFGNKNYLIPRNSFKSFYEENIKEAYLQFSEFLKENGLEDDGRRNYDEYDIRTLIFIKANNEEFSQKLTTIRQFSSLVFKEKGSKYLENKDSVKKAVCKILQIDRFPEEDAKDNQWRLVVDSVHPKAVILCENIAHLKNADKMRNNNIELWYVGGNNVGIIKFISHEKLQLPMYYSCDWDFAGIQIYLRVKKVLKEKNAEIKLLFPYTIETFLSVHSPYHFSEWDLSKPLSGLPETEFCEREITLIKALIEKKHWIEEESLDLVSNFEFNHHGEKSNNCRN
jgi:hypothetical protein